MSRFELGVFGEASLNLAFVSIRPMAELPARACPGFVDHQKSVGLSAIVCVVLSGKYVPRGKYLAFECYPYLWTQVCREPSPNFQR
jgi:hypothetical protein